MSKEDPHALYKALDVPPDATDAELRAGFREAAFRAHPDTGGSPEHLRAVVQAWDTLRDPNKRRRYDQTGQEPEDIDDPDKRANVLIAGMAEEMASNADPRDLAQPVATIRLKILTDMNNGKQAVQQLKSKERRLAKVLGRTRRKMRKGRAMHNIVETQFLLALRNLARVRYDIEDRVTLHARALEIIDEHEDVRDAAEEMARAATAELNKRIEENLFKALRGPGFDPGFTSNPRAVYDDDNKGG